MSGRAWKREGGISCRAQFGARYCSGMQPSYPSPPKQLPDVYPTCLTASPWGIHVSVFDSRYLNRAGIIETFTNPVKNSIKSCKSLEITFFKLRNSISRLISGSVDDYNFVNEIKRRVSGRTTGKRMQLTYYVVVLHRDKLN